MMCKVGTYWTSIHACHLHALPDLLNGLSSVWPNVHRAQLALRHYPRQRQRICSSERGQIAGQPIPVEKVAEVHLWCFRQLHRGPNQARLPALDTEPRLAPSCGGGATRRFRSSLPGQSGIERMRIRMRGSAVSATSHPLAALL